MEINESSLLKLIKTASQKQSSGWYIKSLEEQRLEKLKRPKKKYQKAFNKEVRGTGADGRPRSTNDDRDMPHFSLFGVDV